MKTVGLALAITIAAAQDGEEYLRLLSIAQKHVEARKLDEAGRGPDGASRLRNAVAPARFQPRFFLKGESWTVAVSPVDASAMMSLPGGPVRRARQAQLFECRVADVESAGLAQVDVRQILGEGESPADARVELVRLVLDRAFTVVRKEVRFRDGTPTRISTRGEGGTLAKGFEAFPAELPPVNETAGSPVEAAALPALPAELAAYAARFRINPARAVEFRYQDLYARDVRVVWQQGDPWPSYVETPSGISVLLTR